MSMINDTIVVFGGIWDVTKELNDLHCFSTSTNKWYTMNESSNHDVI